MRPPSLSLKKNEWYGRIVQCPLVMKQVRAVYSLSQEICLIFRPEFLNGGPQFNRDREESWDGEIQVIRGMRKLHYYHPYWRYFNSPLMDNFCYHGVENS